MRRIRQLAPAAAVVALSAACGSGTNQVSNSAAELPTGPSTTSVAPAPTSATPSETPGAKHGAEHKTSVLHLTDQDGYRADVTVHWYAETALTPADLLPGCLPSRAGSTNSGAAENFTGVVADVEATFPPTNGLTWPSDSSLSFSFDDGATSVSDGATTCHTDQDPDSVAAIRAFSLSPLSPKATLMWVRSAKKTPDNPAGTVHSEPDRYNVRSSLYLKSCDGTGVEKGILDCTSAYGLDR